MKSPSPIVVWLALAGLALVAAIQKPPDATLKAEWTAFVKEFDKAQQDWLKPYREAKTEEEREKALDMSKNPVKEFIPRAIAFAERAKGTDWAASAWYWVFSNGQDAATRKRGLDALLAHHIKSDKILQVAAMLQYDLQLGPEKVSMDILERIRKESPLPEVQAQALYSMASRNMNTYSGTEKTRAIAEKQFDELRSKFPNTKAAKRAEGAVFELKNLQIGQVAPDFDAEDENGVKFKLSDYRGKVVVLDFWGFW